jgi:ABC-2 type transport system ATP-binding protein
MRARLSLASALLGDPATLILDEPSNGLDPEGIAWLRQMTRALAAQGRTVLVSSHLLAEVEQSADDVIVIAQGRALYAGPLADLGGRPGTVVATSDPPAFAALAAQHGWQLESDPGGYAVIGPSASEIGQAAATAGIALHQLAERRSGLEAAFLRLTEGRGL